VGHHNKIPFGFLITTFSSTPTHQKMGKSRGKSDPSYEGRLSLAVDAVKNKKIKNVREAARLYDVGRTTL
jgi:hypothetical protein